MIEVILGLGLIAFGLISIAALFPVGLRANQAAMGETYAAQHAEQFLHTVKAVITSAEEDQASWAKYAEVLPTSKPGSSEPDDWDKFLAQDAVLYRIAGDHKQFYRIEQVGIDEDDVQFSAICRVWRSTVVITRYADGLWKDTTYDPSDAIDLNVEISWPADKPYESRRKSLFQLEIFRPEL
jgi:Tfp pilus assembly protein PilV